MHGIIFESTEDFKNQLTAAIYEVFYDIIEKGNFSNNNENPSKKYLSFKEAAQYLNVARPTLYAYNSKRTIPYSNKGKKLYYLKSDLDNFIESHRRKAISESVSEAEAKIRNRKK